MKAIRVIFIALSCATSMLSLAQESEAYVSDVAPLSADRSRGSVVIKQNGEVLHHEIWKPLLRDNPSSNPYYRKFNENSTAVMGLRIVSGGFMGAFLYDMIFDQGGQFNYLLLGASVGTFAISLPFEIQAENRLHEAIDAFNSNITAEEPDYHKTVGLSLVVNGQGVGLQMNF